MQTIATNNSNTNQAFNTNKIKLHTYPDLLIGNYLLRKSLNLESTAYFLDETFYHTHIHHFSQ